MAVIVLLYNLTSKLNGVLFLNVFRSSDLVGFYFCLKNIKFYILFVLQLISLDYNEIFDIFLLLAFFCYRLLIFEL